jgi:cytochrome c oxidase subunit 4
MFGIGWLNLGSLVSGLIAWIIPGITLMQRNKAGQRNLMVFSVASVSACAISLCMQIYSVNLLVSREDWSALMDTSPALVLFATILLGGTLILNAITLVVFFKKTSES